MTGNKPTILFTCGREPAYMRNTVILTGLKRHFNVLEVTDSTRYLPLRYLKLAGKLLRAARSEYDAVFVGFLGQPLMPLVRRLTRKPILFDAFISIYDTLCFDRGTFLPGSLPGKAALWLDKASCTQAELVCLDTQAHACYFNKTLDVPQEKLRAIYVGCNEDLFYPRSNENTMPLVLFYGTYMPIHGIDVIVRAAALLGDRPGLRFRIIGSGMQSGHIRALAEQLTVRNIDFLPPVPLAELPAHIAQASICLGGHFGASDKARRVIAGKTFQCLAMGKPTIVGDNPANRELLTHGDDAWFSQMADPGALASAIRTLLDDTALRQRLGHNARQTFLERASIAALAAPLKQMIEEII